MFLPKANIVEADGRRQTPPKANTAEVENRRIGIAEAESGKTCLARSGRVPDLYRGKVLRFRGKLIHFPRKDG